MTSTVRLATLIVLVLLGADAGAAEKRALLIGINDYRANDAGAEPADGDTWIPEDLQGALNDIALMREVLQSRYGFPPANIHTLENAQATREALVSGLTRFVADTGPDDIVYIHFSGHGSQVEDLDGDEDDGLDETILPYDARTGRVPDITDDELGRLLAGLSTPNALVVLDSCHSGTATRGGSQLRARATPMDRRGDVYAGLTGAAGATGSEQPWVLMTGAADYQSALDGPIDEGRFYGLFSLSLGRTMARMAPGSTLQSLYGETRREMERIGQQFGLFAVPDAQLEVAGGRDESGVLGEQAVTLARRNASRLAWVETSVMTDGRVRLGGGGALAALPGSTWAVYPADETEFAPGRMAGLVTVDEIRGADALARAEGGGVPAAGRAVLLAPAPPDQRVPIRLDRMDAASREAIAGAMASLPGGDGVQLVPPGRFARFVVDKEGDRYTAHDASGLQVVKSFDAADARIVAQELTALARRSRTVNEVLALDNPASAMGLSVRVRPVDLAGNTRGVAVVGAADAPAFRVRGPGEPRSRANSLQLDISVAQDSWITVVDVDPDGLVSLLFPNPASERNGFLPGGFVPGGSAVRIPDALADNRAGFYWDYVPPVGLDTLRVFAAGDPDTARRLRDYLSGYAGPMAQRGGGAAEKSRLALYGPVAMTTRGVAVVDEETPSPDWTAVSLTVLIEE